MIVLIAAMNQHKTIGLDGSMPWRNPEDLKHFRETTLNHTVVMGRKTFEGLPKHLDQRDMRIVTLNKDYPNRIEDFEEFLNNAQNSEEIIYIAGGGEIYRQSLPYAHRLVLSYIDNDVIGDTFFPDFSMDEFTIVSRSEKETFLQITYERIV